MRILVIHGPNLNLLGQREPEIYGSQTLAQIDAMLAHEARSLGCEITCAQYNAEGEIIDALHGAMGSYQGVVVNPGAYSHYSLAIADAISAISIPVVEVHLSNIAAREEFRRVSIVARSCRASVAGFGADSYRLALRGLAKMLEN